MTRTAAARVVRGLAALLEEPSAHALANLAPRRDAESWAAVRRLITIHGLAPYLASHLAPADLEPAVPATTVEWLLDQRRLNAERIERMHIELAAILAACAAAGIAVMPLKGALLTTMPGSDPPLRPMGDLDLLVRPADKAQVGRLLIGLGYRREHENNPRPTHDVYVDPGGGRVVSVDEHPDNPRRVEVHVELVRHLWGWNDDDRLTGAMWSDATEGTALGQPALISTPAHVLSHVAIHASADLLAGEGRLVQWLDLASMVAAAGDFDGGPQPRLAYPALALARRTLPCSLESLDVSAIAAGLPARLVRWASRVPADDRCGLMIGPTHGVPHSLRARVNRWAPIEWRLWVAYGERSRPVALAMHSRLLVSRWRGRFRYRHHNRPKST